MHQILKKKDQDGLNNAKKATPIQTQHHAAYNVTHYKNQTLGLSLNSRPPRSEEAIHQALVPHGTTDAPHSLESQRIGE
jgi:hypothetical protein